MKLHRVLSPSLPCLALLAGSLACALPARTTPVPNEANVALTVQAVLASQPTAVLPTEIPPTAVPPTVVISVTPTLPPTVTPTPTQTPIPTLCDAAQFVADVTIADDSSVTINTEFTKIWRLRNTGTCSWTSGYQLVFDHGDRMSAPDAVMLTSGTVPPGSTVDVSVALKAPGTAGTYQGFFKLRNPSGVLFGIGADANTAFWVKIKAETFLLLVPLPMIPIFPLYHSTGTGKTLAVDKCFDLDAGGSIACSNGDADFRFVDHMLLGERLDPLNGARMSTTDHASTPSKGTCSSEATVTSPVPLKTTTFCYQTSAGRWGWLKVNGFNSSTVGFDWGTY